jgi:hypothetical protein
MRLVIVGQKRRYPPRLTHDHVLGPDSWRKFVTVRAKGPASARLTRDQACTPPQAPVVVRL